MNEDLQRVYKKDSSLTFVSGDLGSGKTDMALLLLEKGKKKGVFDRIAANVTTDNDPNLDYICYFDRLEEWLKLSGSKAFLLDELGINLYRLSFMSKQSKLILKTIQLIRKFRCHLFGIAPTEEFVNKHFYHLMEVHIKKLSRKSAVIQNYYTKNSYPVYSIPRTTVRFHTRDVATFELKDPTRKIEDWENKPRWEQVARLYIKHRSLRKVGKILGLSAPTIQEELNIASKHEPYAC